MGLVIQRFDIFLVSMDPKIDSEIQKTRWLKTMGQLNQEGQKMVLSTLAELVEE